MRDVNLNPLREWGAARIATAAFAAWLLLWGVAVSAEQADVLRAGTAKKDITPAKPVMLAGYASRTDLSQGVHDPISARVIAFEQNGKKLVLVSTDIVGFYGGTAASMRKAILEACGLQPSELFLAAIHTHSAPIVALGGKKVHPNNVEYTKWLETQLVAAVREGLAHTAPVQIAVGTGSSPVGVNRREFVKDAVGRTSVQLGRNPDVLTDREVQVLRVSRADSGDLAAVIFAYATHSTAMGPHNYLVSGDVHGLAAQFLEKYLEGEVVAPGFAGASGDIDPWVRVLPKFHTEKGWVPEAVLMGTMLGEEVASVLEGIKRPCRSGPLKTAFKTLALPLEQRVKFDASTGAESPEFNLTVGRLGNVAIVGLGGEVFNQIGKAIKTASPFPHTLIITHCNGAAGYLPTKEACPEGGYGVDNSPFGPDAAGMIVKEAVRLLRDL
ncbi:MAG: neutral/alkaline non-lysosomal ceramidase N-terminal domain-containing protein [Thermoguttaceae bacterium]